LLKVGMGYDIHRLSPGRKLMLGGIAIPHPSGPVGHSDGDVLIHAIIDAILGACSLGDIGTHFPDDAPQYRDIASVELLRRTLEMASAVDAVEHVDATVVAEQPRLAGHIRRMRETIAAAIGIGSEHISIKAKTAEGLGPVGEGVAIEAYAVALVRLHK
jgi:2-C-methyl-D-erythritol 2,4-cyclodiphosphate synthase